VFFPPPWWFYSTSIETMSRPRYTEPLQSLDGGGMVVARQ